MKPVSPFLLLFSAVVAVTSVLALPGSAGAAVATVSFGPEADTYVSSAYPTTAFGTTTALSADASPKKQAFLRFDVQGLAGRPVVDARLRLYSTDGSNSGGRVFSASSVDWSESITWNTRPAVDGPRLAELGSVATGNFYEVDLGGAIQTDGKVTLAIDSLSSDEVRWASRESTKPTPRLILELESGDAVADGLSVVAAPSRGATDPTGYGLQRRLATTQSGRLLSVHVPHKAGPQLAWRDPAGTWQTQSTGESLNGSLLAGSGSGINPASIVVGPGDDGTEHAWVVFGGSSTSSTLPVYLRRLTDLDSPAGPRIGPLVTLNAAGSKPDIELVTTPGGQTAAVVLWSRLGAGGVYELVAGWLSDPDGAAPSLVDRTVLSSSTSAKLWGTLASHSDGSVRAIARTNSRIVSYQHSASAPPGEWTASLRGLTASGYGYHSAVTLDSGETLAAVEADSVLRVVKVQRFSAANAPLATELSLSGYFHPTLATDGTDAWLVMIRASDGYVVSRRLSAGVWSSTDRVEIGAEGGGNLSYPNAMRRTDGRLRLIVRGPKGPTSSQNGAIAYQRPLSAP